MSRGAIIAFTIAFILIFIKITLLLIHYKFNECMERDQLKQVEEKALEQNEKESKFDN